jgi:hypothetical protein
MRATYLTNFILVNFTQLIMSVSGDENRDYGRRDPSRWARGTLYPQKVGNHFADKQRSLGQYSSLADSGHRVKWWRLHIVKLPVM